MVPTLRERYAFIIVDKEETVSATDITTAIRRSIDALKPLGVHHVSSFIRPQHADRARKLSAYNKCPHAICAKDFDKHIEFFKWESLNKQAYRKIFEQAVELDLIPNDNSDVTNPSNFFKPHCLTHWQRAQIDVTSLMVAIEKETIADSDKQDGASYHVGDISQTLGRVMPLANGTIMTFTTSTLPFDFERNIFFTPEECFAMHGFPVDDMHFASFSDEELRTILGNAICLPTFSHVAIACLSALGYMITMQ
jgi:site-specific DNA-cytosine methylase